MVLGDPVPAIEHPGTAFPGGAPMMQRSPEAFREDAVAASRDLDENTILDVDAEGDVRGITFEHASECTDVHRLSVEGIAA